MHTAQEATLAHEPFPEALVKPSAQTSSPSTGDEGSEGAVTFRPNSAEFPEEAGPESDPDWDQAD